MGECVIYTRVSSQEQAEGYSIDAQLNLLKEYAMKKDLTIVREFSDKETAKRGSARKGFHSMLDFIQGNGVKTVLCEKVDRFSRNFKDAQVIEDSSIEVHFVKEGEVISSQLSSHKKLMFGFKTLLAKFYLDNLSEETKKGMVEKAQQGGYPSLAPIGYKNNPLEHTVEVDPERAGEIKEAFRLYATGHYSFRSLKKEMDKRGLRTRKGSKISKHGLQKALKNPFYYGDFLWSNRLWGGNHKPLISKQLYDKVQAMLERKNSSRSKGKWFVFRGLLMCGYCGSLITAETKKGRYTYYHCTKGKECKQRWWREEEIEAKFVEALGGFSLNDKVREWAKKALLLSHEEEETFIKNKLKRLRTEQAKNETRLHQVYNDKLKGVIDQEFFESEFRQTKQRQADIKREVERLEAKNLDYMEEGLRILELMQSIKNVYLKADMEDKAKILRLLLQNCTLKGVSIRFYWNSPFDLLVKLGQTNKRGERGVSNPQPLDPQSSALTS